MAEEKREDMQEKAQDDVLKELGIDLPSVEQIITEQERQPDNPFTPQVPQGLEEIGKSMIVGAIVMLEQAVSFYGLTSSNGKTIMQAINKLLDVVPEDEVEKLKAVLFQPDMMMGTLPIGVPPTQGKPPMI